MIDEIQVQNLALIRDASIAPCAGLTVVTGETGAGKTALLSALKLLMGERASADMVRDGEAALVVSGRFFGLDEQDPAARSFALAGEGADTPDEEGEMVAVRRVGADGRSRASLNGAMASMKELAARVAPSVDLCGQFEHQQLMRPSAHVRMLDRWAAADIAPAAEAYAAAFDAAARAATELARVQEAGQTSSAKLDEARFTLRRIDEVAPREGEYEQLARDLERAEHAESLSQAAQVAYTSLAGDSGALDALNAAASALESASSADAELGDLAQSLREAGYVLEDVASQARSYRDGIEFDPETLVAQQDRFGLLQGLMRSFGPTMDAVFAARAEAAETVSLVDDSELRLRQARRAVEAAEGDLAAAADALDAARGNVAPAFARAVTDAMGRLQMGGAELVCSSRRLDRAAWTPSGPSAFEFLYRPAPDMQARPLARIASGGEVSRVMLAVKVVLGAQDYVGTLVFDEVDAGVGGAVAVALAEEIARLAKTHQVIVVTHLAQVAVKGDAHYLVRRVDAEAGAETEIVPVEGEARVGEIARMLSGSETEASLAHARELLRDA